MSEIEINTESLKQINKTLEQIAQKSADNTELMRNIAGTLESVVLTNFEQGGRPVWAGLKHREGKPLVDTENLMSSIISQYDKQSAEVGTNLEYAPVHQFGGKAGRGRKVTIPARPFLQLTAEDEEEILARVQDYFRQLVE
ncbi:phage virion morphogenesis protein [[Haemophilus] felis]|uniref:Phage virion morphogenesis protein n=1 Tax=[Haemophilus] felis TaxID=123822 RepID=A0A1T0BA58_9PAST|nr:phage virion morphogenesis protein [[Haemophilus] felis]OOS07100.1 phage virion morphogenesis protein [[Haemophilus] felis]